MLPFVSTSYCSAGSCQLAQRDKSINSISDLCQRERGDDMGVKRKGINLDFFFFFLCHFFSILHKFQAWKGQRLAPAYHQLGGRRHSVAGINSEFGQRFIQRCLLGFLRVTVVIWRRKTKWRLIILYDNGISDSIIDALPAAKLAWLL